MGGRAGGKEALLHLETLSLCSAPNVPTWSPGFDSSCLCQPRLAGTPAGSPRCLRLLSTHLGICMSDVHTSPGLLGSLRFSLVEPTLLSSACLPDPKTLQFWEPCPPPPGSAAPQRGTTQDRARGVWSNSWRRPSPSLCWGLPVPFFLQETPPASGLPLLGRAGPGPLREGRG